MSDTIYTYICTYKYREFLIASCESAIPFDSVYMLQHTERRDSCSHGGSQLALREQSLTLRERKGERPSRNVTNIVATSVWKLFVFSIHR